METTFAQPWLLEQLLGPAPLKTFGPVPPHSGTPGFLVPLYVISEKAGWPLSGPAPVPEDPKVIT